MPHAPLGGVALVGDPHVGLEILKLVILHVLLGVTHHLEDQQVAPVREDERPLLAQRRVERFVELVGIPPHELVFERARRQPLEARRRREGRQRLRLRPHDVAVHVRRTHLQPRNVAIVLDVRLPRGNRDVEVGQDELPFQLRVALRVEQRDLQQVMALQHLRGNAQLLRDQAHRRDAAALPVAAVLHLDGRLVDESPSHRHGAGEARDAAAAFLGRLGRDGPLVHRVDLRPAGQ